MIFVPTHLGLVAAPARMGLAQPRFLVSMGSGTSHQSHRGVITLYRIVTRKGGESGLRKVASTPFLNHATLGITMTLPQTGTPRFAFEYRSGSGGRSWVDVWSARPLARTAAIPCWEELSAAWLPGRDLLAVVEIVGGQYRTRVVDARGRTVVSLDRCLGIFADPRGRTYAARYAPSVSSAEIGRATPTVFNAGLAALLATGRAWFEARDRAFGRPRRLSVESATRALVGRGDSPVSLALLADPQLRPVGLARHWLRIRAREKGYRPDGAFEVYDTLSGPKGDASILRDDGSGSNCTWAVAADGSLLWSGPFDTPVLDRYGTRAVRLEPGGRRREWRVGSVGLNTSTFVLWGR